MRRRSLTTRWATLRPSPCKIDGKLVMMEGPGPGSTTKDDNNSSCRTCSTTRFPSTCSPMSASPTSAEVDPILRLWWCEMNGMVLMLTGGCTTVGLGQQPLWWTLACRPAIQMGRCDSFSAEVDPLLAALVDQMMIQLPPSEDSHQCLRARASPTMRTCEELMVEALQTMQQHRPFWPNPWMMDKINEPCCPHLLAV